MLLPIHTLPPLAEERQPERELQETYDFSGTTRTVAENSVETAGIASYYAKRYAGRKTTSGARYNPERMTAAHHDLPLGTRVKVTNLSNNKEVVVTVNDRCRKGKEPFIDLSRAAAMKLGFLGKGKARVKIVPFEETAAK